MNKKLATISVFGIMMGLIISGAGVAGIVQPFSAKIALESGSVTFGMVNNSSFLAPVGITYTINPMYSPFYMLYSPFLRHDHDLKFE
jgi:hypothetical protein